MTVMHRPGSKHQNADNQTQLKSVETLLVGDAITALGPTTSGSVSRKTLMPLCLSQSGKCLMPTNDPVIGKLLQWTRDAGEPSQHELFLSGEALSIFGSTASS